MNLKLFLFCLISINSYSNSNFAPYLFSSKMFEKQFYRIVETTGEKTNCARDLKLLFNDVVRMQKWALEMVDASAKLPNGILVGNSLIAGNFDECLDISHQINNHTIKGQYCSVYFVTNIEESSNKMLSLATIAKFLGFKIEQQAMNALKHIKMTYGMCIPNSCSIENLQTIWNNVENSFHLPFRFVFNDYMCWTADKEVVPTFAIDKYVIYFFVIYIVFIILCTLYDKFVERDENEINVWISFSLYANCKKIFIYHESNDNSLRSVNGLKVINMVWILLGHRLLLTGVFGISNLLYLSEWKKQAYTQIIVAVPFAVDTFFALSGFLLSYGYLKHWSGNGNKHLKCRTMYFFRMLRLSPSLTGLILFNMSIFKYFGDGPIWALILNKLALGCRNTWWATLFYCVNFVPMTNQCVEQSWYLAVDSQLFFISPVLLVLLTKKPKRTVKYLIFICLVVGIYSFVKTVQNDFGVVVTATSRKYYEEMYISPLTRSPPWLIGFIFGYYYFKHEHIKLKKTTKIAIWSSLVALFISLISSFYYFNNAEHNSYHNGLFNALGIQLWALLTCGVVFMCTTNNGGFLNDFLSLPIFQILVRVSYSFYMIQIPILLYSKGTLRHSEYFSNFNLVHDFFGDLFLVYTGAVIWCLAFESPYINIAKILIKKRLRNIKEQELKGKYKRKQSWEKQEVKKIN